jgi:acetyltransferase
LTILSNAGGPAVLATDALITEGGQLAEWLLNTGSARTGFFRGIGAIRILSISLATPAPTAMRARWRLRPKDPNSDGLLVILSPQGMTNPSEIAERLKPYAKLAGKPVLASWMGGDQVADGERILNDAGVPTFPFPDTAARMFNDMWRYSANLQGLYETLLIPRTLPKSMGSELTKSSRKRAAKDVCY